MKKNRRLIMILALSICSVFCAEGCGRNIEIDSGALGLPYWDGEDAKYVSVSVNCSAYGRWNEDWQDMFAPQFFLDESKSMEVIGDSDYHTYTLKVPADTGDLYVLPPKIELIQKMEEQLIPLNQDYPIQTEYFNVISAYIPELTDWNPVLDPNYSTDSIVISVYLTSGTEQYPEFLSLRYDGKSYPFQGSQWESDDNRSIRYLCHQCEMPDLYTAAMAIKYGTLRYSKLRSFITAVDATYECDDKTVTIHELEAPE